MLFWNIPWKYYDYNEPSDPIFDINVSNIKVSVDEITTNIVLKIRKLISRQWNCSHLGNILSEWSSATIAY